MNVQDFFPNAIRNHQSNMGSDWISIEQENDFIHIPVAGLTEREEVLLQLLQFQIEDGLPEDDWSRYFTGLAPIPQKIESAQLVYIDHTMTLSDDLLELYRNLLPNCLAIARVAQHRTVLVLNQEKNIDAIEVMKDTLPAIESDFGIRMTVFFGNSWSRLQEGDLATYFQQENQLFSSYLKEKRSTSIMTFSRLVLWGLAHQIDLSGLSQKVLQWMDDSKEMREIVSAMWETHGNLVQTAQLLFMHRNSLQYKLEKFTNLSGLNLKNLDDLALCYLLLLKE
ncbi:helix-turn-helix domain-containing protein [Streptococcus cameli]